MTTPRRIIRLDASSLKSASCLRRLYLKVALGYRGVGVSSQLTYGTCFHHFAEQLEIKGPAASHQIISETQVMFQEQMKSASVARGKDYMDVMHLTRTCLAYMAHRVNEATSYEVLKSPIDGTPLVEVKFSMPLAIIGQYEFLLQGTIDRIAKVKGGCLCLRDFKTTSLKNPDAYFKAEKMSPQMKTYSYAVQMMALAYPDSIFGALLRSNPAIGCFIDGVFLDPKDSTIFVSGPASFYSSAELKAYERWLFEICARLAVALDAGEWPEAEGTFNDTCRSAFGSFCSFFDVCSAQQPWSVSKTILDHHMKQTDYTPLDFGGGDKPKDKVVIANESPNKS